MKPTDTTIERPRGSTPALKETGDDSALSDYQKKFDQLRQQAEGFIAKRPEVCLAVALTLGVALGWIVKRR